MKTNRVLWVLVIVALLLSGAVAAKQFWPAPATNIPFVNLTNATGDKITNTTAGDFVGVYAADATNWVVWSINGTWADGN
jgi:lipopolysaccharide export LptBFGC system permease protein LptF